MHKPLKTGAIIALTVAVLCNAAPSHGVSISGVLLYSADEFGNPSGFETLDGQLQAQLWRTLLGGDWHVLGVWSGLPPQSFASPPVNGPDVTVEIPLSDGENNFTIVGQPGPGTRIDDYARYALNLYFDGVLDHPGISVLFPRLNNPAGSPVAANRSDHIYSLGLDPVSFAPQATYDNGVVSVSVTAASFLAPEDLGADVDLVSAQSLVPSGADDPNGSDYIGVLKVKVVASPSSSIPATSAGGCQAVRVAPRSELSMIVPGAFLVLLVWRRRRSVQPRPGDHCARASANPK